MSVIVISDHVITRAFVFMLGELGVGGGGGRGGPVIGDLIILIKEKRIFKNKLVKIHASFILEIFRTLGF